MLSVPRAAARLLAPALLLLTLPALSVVPAQAAEPELVTGWSVDVAPTVKSTTTYPSTVTSAAYTVSALSFPPGTVRWSSYSDSADLTAPGGRRLAPGESFVAQGRAQAGEGRFDVPSTCASDNGFGTERVTVRVQDVAYGQGDVPTRLVASYDGTCAVDPTVRVSGVLRIAAQAPYVAASAARADTTALTPALGETATTTVTVTSRGPSATVPAAPAFLGETAAEYAVVADGCVGRELAPGAGCDLVVAFRPTEPGFRPVVLSVPMSGHPRTDGALLVVEGGGANPPRPPDVVRAYASTSGAGVAFKGPGSQYADTYWVYRDSGSGPVRVGVKTDAAGFLFKTFLDPELQPGDSATYSIAAVRAGAPGLRSAGVVVRRLVAQPRTGTTRAIAAESETGSTSGVSVDARRGESVSVFPGVVSGTLGGGNGVQLVLPPLPGPGTYAIDPGSDDAATGRVRVELAMGSGTCPLASGTLRVDDVAYDAELRPVVLAAEVAGQCGSLGTWRAVVRWDSPLPYRAADVTRERLSQTVAGTSAEPVVVTVTNRGDLPLTAGVPSLSGSGEALWSVDRGACATPVPVGGSCDLRLVFAPQAGGGTSALLRVPLDTASGGWTTSLTGQSVVPPGAPLLRGAHPVTGGVELSWDGPDNPFWVPVTYTLFRTVAGRTTTIGTTGGRVFLDRSPVAGATWAVSATNAAGEGPRSAAIGLFVDPGSGFEEVAPTRLLDTRTGVGAPRAAVGPGGSVRLRVAGVAGVPFGASAVVLNVTAVGATASGFVTVHPAGVARPETSSLNTTRGLVTPNLVVVKVGTNGEVVLYNSSGSVHLLADLAGYHINTAAAPRFSPLSPSRVLDTRNGTGAPRGAVAAGRSVRVRVTDVPGAPLAPTAVVLNVTAVGATASGFVTAYASGVSLPSVSNLNTTRGLVTPNLVVVPVGADGSVDLFNSSGSVHLLADVAGFYARDEGGAGFQPVSPRRLLDTRTGLGAPRAAVPGGRSVGLRVTGVGGLPATGVTAVVLNVTAVGATADGFVTVHPAGAPRPLASSLNTARGRVTPNLVVVKVGAGGVVELFNSIGSVHLLADVAGYYTG